MSRIIIIIIITTKVGCGHEETVVAFYSVRSSGAAPSDLRRTMKDVLQRAERNQWSVPAWWRSKNSGKW